jgi:hypothetical protein
MTDDTPLSFHDEQAESGPVTCSRCEQSLTEYWTLDGAVLCERCANELQAERTSGEGAAARVGKAFAFGIGGMLVGAGVWYAVAKLANLEVGLIAILLGWLVGKGVHLGSEKRGGLGYQVMAVLITYLGIGVAGVPFAIDGWNEAQQQMVDSLAAVDSASSPTIPMDSMTDAQLDAEIARLDSAIAAGKELESEATPGLLGVVVGLGALVILALMVPVLSIIGGQSIIGILIYGFALWEAWKFAAATDAALSGPHPVAGAPS